MDLDVGSQSKDTNKRAEFREGSKSKPTRRKAKMIDEETIGEVQRADFG